MALSKEQQDFFASERTKRQNTQDKVIDDAEEILDSDSSSDTELTEAQENVERIISFFTTQDTIETIVKAKGFSDCLCCITDMGVTVIVPKNELNENTVLSIYDAVTTHYEIALNPIHSVNNKNSIIKHPERSLHLCRKIHVSRGVQKCHFRVTKL